MRCDIAKFPCENDYGCRLQENTPKLLYCVFWLTGTQIHLIKAVYCQELSVFYFSIFGKLLDNAKIFFQQESLTCSVFTYIRWLWFGCNPGFLE